jgi:hypothetical protein
VTQTGHTLEAERGALNVSMSFNGNELDTDKHIQRSGL